MKRALTAIASVGILAVTVGVETANAQSYRRYGPARTYTSPAYTPQSHSSVRREGVLRTTPFADPNSPEATGGGSLGYNRALPHWWEAAGLTTAIAGKCPLTPSATSAHEGDGSVLSMDTAERSARRDGGGCRYLVRL